MRIKTKEATGPTLDWLVAKCEDTPVLVVFNHTMTGPAVHDAELIDMDVDGDTTYSPSNDRCHGGSIIEREGISTIRVDDDYGHDADGFCNNVPIPVWCATRGQHGTTGSTEHQSHGEMFQIYETDVVYGPTPLIAGLRCYVASRLGEEVKVPGGLLVHDGKVPKQEEGAPHRRQL